MTVAKHAYAHELLRQQLFSGQLSRTYLAVCEGHPPTGEGVIDLPIGRAEGAVLTRQVCSEGQPACTHYAVVRETPRRCLLRLWLDTGRTHQIRVHMAHLGCPLTGDFLYGQERSELPHRVALHSAELSLGQPVTGMPLSFSCPLPPELAALLDD